MVTLALLAMAVVGAVDVEVAGATGFAYPFTSTSESWRSYDGEAFHSAAWSSGAISVTDTPSGGFSAFLTPVAFGGDYSANYGGTFSFEIKSTQTWSEEEFINLFGTGNGEEPVCAYVNVTPGTTNQTAQVTLTAGNFFGGIECEEEATDAEVVEVLKTLGLIVIFGDDEPGSGETTTIDNVDLSGGTAPPKHKLTVLKDGAGSGTVTSSPAGIDCGAGCSAEFVNGAKVTLTATPAAGSTFAGWSGGGCSGTAPCRVSLGTDREVTAHFAVAASTPTPTPTPISPPKKKPLTCKKGFKKKKVHGAFRCVKLKHHKNKHHKSKHHH
jgi:List-Bact-rpt repeat protein